MATALTPAHSTALSPEVQQILDTPPVWLVRWGNVLLLLLILVGTGAASLFRYPATVSGQATVRPHHSVVRLTGADARKVHVGQGVIIRLNEFPSETYGTLRGVVAAVSAPNSRRQTTVAVALPPRFVTSYHKVLPVRQRASGSAQIIITDKTLLDRLLASIRLR